MRTIRLLGAAAIAVAVLVPVSQAGADPTCGWAAKTEPDTVNVAYPDTNATYWSHPYAAVPGTELVVHGTYPRARYFSFNVYQPSGVPIDSTYDVKIAPDKGSSNPYAGGSRTAHKQSYTVHVRFEAEPATPAPNTIYAGNMKLGDVKNPGGLLMLRVYTPVDPTSPQGGVPLPTVTTQTTTGQVLTTGGACSTDLPSTGGAGTTALNGSSRPVEEPVGPGVIAWGKAFGNDAAGFFGNQQNAYLTAGIKRIYGPLVVIHAKAMRYPDTSRGIQPSPTDQVRYWSFCQNSNSTRVNSCTSDHETALDRKGYYTIVISDPSQRPANAVASKGVTWIPWGVADDSATVIYRNMVATFPHAVQSVSKGDDPVKVMGAYYPSARYCTKAGFEHGGWRGCAE
ncbi:MAG: putative secreted protein [Frankiales bacterium]|nr:putative secreted protein [Frankiales bacterium]